MQQTHFTVKYLSQDDIPAFMGLYEIVPDEKKPFLKPRTEDDLRDHLGAPMPVLGVYNEQNELVAGGLLTYPKHIDKTRYLEGYPLDHTTAVLQSVVSTQKGAVTTLIDVAKNLAAMKGHTNILVKVNDANECGVRSFSKNGFEIIQTGPDPLGGGYTAHFMRAVANDFIPTQKICPISALHAPDPQGYQLLTAALQVEY